MSTFFNLNGEVVYVVFFHSLGEGVFLVFANLPVI
jgi:hypothetical protein